MKRTMTRSDFSNKLDKIIPKLVTKNNNRDFISLIKMQK